jgi:tetratricopeptide (TPR) repeat protein
MKAISLIVISALAAVPSPARAGEPDALEAIPPKARLLATKGRAAHEHGDYAGAIAAFKEAYVMAPAPELLFNLAQAYRIQGNCEDAAMMYHRYLGSNPSPDARTLAEAHLATVERCVHQRGLHIPMDASMAYLELAPPPPAPGPMVDTPAAAPRSAGKLEQTIGIGVTIGGGAALAVAGYYAYQAHEASQEVEHAYAIGGKGKDVAAIDARGIRAATTAKIFGIAGGAAVVTGVTLFVLGKRAEHLPPIAIAPTRSGAEVSYAWRF